MARRKSSALGEIPKGFRLTNPGRVLYPDLGLTKLDLVRYYAAVAEWMLPEVAGRPLSLVRCPSGLSGPAFYQKHPPEGLSEAVPRVPIEDKDGPREHVYVRDAEGLLSLVQFGVLEIHTWGSRVDRIERPDRMVFDLDPDPDVPWERVVQSALVVKDLLEQLKLVSFAKASGGKGVHLVVPLDRRHSWPQVKQFAKAVADFLATSQPGVFVANMSKAIRKGRIFIDYLRNARGSTSIAAYSTRARAGAPVAVPLSWTEVGPGIGPAAFSVHNLPARLKSLKRDPWEGIEDVRQSLRAAAIRSLRAR